MQPTLALISPGARSADKAGVGRLEKAGARANCASIRPSTYPVVGAPNYATPA